MTHTCTDIFFASRLRRLVAIPTLLGLAGALILQESAHGSPQVSADAEAAYLGSATPAQTAASGTASDADSGFGDSGEPRYGDNTAFASFGSLTATSTIGVLPRASSSPYAALGVSTASFCDDFLIDAEGLTGTTGTVTVRFTIDGSLSVNPSGTPVYNASRSNTYAQATYTFGVAPTNGQITESQRLRYDGTTSGTPFLGIEQEHVLNFTFGSWLNDVTLIISTSAAAGGEGSTYLSNTTADLSQAVWGGFVEVRDSNNNLVNSYSFSSGSGTDYTQAVPEPATASLFALGACVALLRSRRRR